METDGSGDTLAAQVKPAAEIKPAEEVKPAVEVKPAETTQKNASEKTPAKKDSKDSSEKNQKDGSNDRRSGKRSDRTQKRRFEQDSNYDRNKRSRYSWQASDRSPGRSWGGDRGGQGDHAFRSSHPGQVFVKDADLGISQFIGTHKGFDGVFRQKYSDVIINEVANNGEVVKIINTAVPELPQVNVNVIPKNIKASLQGLLDETSTEAVEVPVDRVSAEDRSKLHLAIRSLSSKLLTTTEERDGNIYITAKLRDPKENVIDEKVWHPAAGDYVHFIMHKDSVDTAAAISHIAKLLDVKEILLSYADGKEKNAKSTQLASIYRVDPETLNSLNKKLKNVTVGNFAYSKTQLTTGDLTANSYQIIFRNTNSDNTVVEESVKSLQEQGFVNYFGLGVFGITSIPNYLIGRALMKWNWKDVIEYVLRPRDGGEDNLRYVRKLYSNTKDAARAYRPLQNKQLIEGRLLQGIMKHDKTPFKAVRMVPRNLRAMYVNSYQCYVWNSIASKRIEKHGLKPIVGDLIIRGPVFEQICDGWYVKEEEKVEPEPVPEPVKETKPAEEEKAKSAEEEKAKPAEEEKTKSAEEEKPKEGTSTDENKEKTEEKMDDSEEKKPEVKASKEEKKETKKEEIPEPEEGKEEEVRYKSRVEVVTEANLDKFTIYDVVLPMPGYDVTYPENEVGEWYKELFEKDGVDFKDKDKLKVYALTGSYRRLVVKPKDVTWKTIQYNTSQEPLLLTDYDRMVRRTRTGEAADGKFKAVQVEFSIPAASHLTSAVRELLKRAPHDPPPKAPPAKKEEPKKSKEEKTADVNATEEGSSSTEKKDASESKPEEAKPAETNGGTEEPMET